jgi:hypothetical protein
LAPPKSRAAGREVGRELPHLLDLADGEQVVVAAHDAH